MNQVGLGNCFDLCSSVAGVRGDISGGIAMDRADLERALRTQPSTLTKDSVVALGPLALAPGAGS